MIKHKKIIRWKVLKIEQQLTEMMKLTNKDIKASSMYVYHETKNIKEWIKNTIVTG